MAWVTSIRKEVATGKRQPTNVEAVIKIFDTADSRSVIQIDTRGSDERENPGKQSQTLQFGEEAAKELFVILKQTFKFE
jgi:hypothetical protein